MQIYQTIVMLTRQKFRHSCHCLSKYKRYAGTQNRDPLEIHEKIKILERRNILNMNYITIIQKGQTKKKHIQCKEHLNNQAKKKIDFGFGFDAQ